VDRLRRLARNENYHYRKIPERTSRQRAAVVRAFGATKMKSSPFLMVLASQLCPISGTRRIIMRSFGATGSRLLNQYLYMFVADVALFLWLTSLHRGSLSW
jgi:hypothetical protein